MSRSNSANSGSRQNQKYIRRRGASSSKKIGISFGTNPYPILLTTRETLIDTSKLNSVQDILLHPDRFVDEHRSRKRRKPIAPTQRKEGPPNKAFQIEVIQTQFKMRNPEADTRLIDWQAYVDSTLTISENIDILEYCYPTFHWRAISQEQD